MIVNLDSEPCERRAKGAVLRLGQNGFQVALSVNFR